MFLMLQETQAPLHCDFEHEESKRCLMPLNQIAEGSAGELWKRACVACWTAVAEEEIARCEIGVCPAAGTFHSNLPKIIQTLRFSLLHKDKRTFADASDQKADW